MTTYYLRAEGVNMNNFIFDTHDISTIRGGSFLMREAFIKNEAEWKKLKLSIISLESNSGLFSFQAKDDHDSERIRTEVLRILDEFCQNSSTFVVDYIKRTDDFKLDFQTLLAKNRWRQFNELTIKYPKKVRGQKFYCELNGVNPGYKEWTKGNEKKLISKSVLFRKQKGIKLRRKFSKEILTIKELKFTDDLKSLADDPAQGNLNGKIAFIYLDGNRFGKIRNEVCSDPAVLTDFQNKIQNDIRKSALKHILEYAQRHKTFKTKNGEIKLEVLMWGGDEIELVVPAWHGWRILTLFFNPELINSEFGRYKLTHSAGVVFCHANAPILHIRKLAKEKICEEVKNEIYIPKAIDKISSKHNLIGITVLDSIDQLYQKQFDERLIIKAAALKDIESNILILKRYFSHNKIYSIENLSETDIKKAEEERDKAIKLLPNNIRAKVKNAITSITNDDIKKWTIIANLWNFIVREEK